MVLSNAAFARVFIARQDRRGWRGIRVPMPPL
jgi:hypothetical protein